MMKRFLTACMISLLLGLQGIPASADTPYSNTRIVINTAARTLSVYSSETLVRLYPVGVGQVSIPTPVGNYSVITKVENPVWEDPYKAKGVKTIRPGKRNPLGTRWIGFLQDNGGEYGIHGTNQPASVGQYSTHGCVRMQIADAEELFDLVDYGTPVQVVYELTEVAVSPDGAVHIKVFPDVFKLGFPSVGSIKSQIQRRFPSARINDTLLTQRLSQPSDTPAVVGHIDTQMADLPPADPNVDFHIRISN